MKSILLCVHYILVRNRTILASWSHLELCQDAKARHNGNAMFTATVATDACWLEPQECSTDSVLEANTIVSSATWLHATHPLHLRNGILGQTTNASRYNQPLNCFLLLHLLGFALATTASLTPCFLLSFPGLRLSPSLCSVFFPCCPNISSQSWKPAGAISLHKHYKPLLCYFYQFTTVQKAMSFSQLLLPVHHSVESHVIFLVTATSSPQCRKPCHSPSYCYQFTTVQKAVSFPQLLLPVHHSQCRKLCHSPSYREILLIPVHCLTTHVQHYRQPQDRSVYVLPEVSVATEAIEDSSRVFRRYSGQLQAKHRSNEQHMSKYFGTLSSNLLYICNLALTSHRVSSYYLH